MGCTDSKTKSPQQKQQNVVPKTVVQKQPAKEPQPQIKQVDQNKLPQDAPMHSTIPA